MRIFVSLSSLFQKCRSPLYCIFQSKENVSLIRFPILMSREKVAVKEVMPYGSCRYSYLAATNIAVLFSAGSIAELSEFNLV